MIRNTHYYLRVFPPVPSGRTFFSQTFAWAPSIFQGSAPQRPTPITWSKVAACSLPIAFLHIISMHLPQSKIILLVYFCHFHLFILLNLSLEYKFHEQGPYFSCVPPYFCTPLSLFLLSRHLWINERIKIPYLRVLPDSRMGCFFFRLEVGKWVITIFSGNHVAAHRNLTISLTLL